MHVASWGPGSYDFLAPPRIVFGAGRIAEIGGVVASLGRSAWLVVGGRSGTASGGVAAVETACRGAGVATRIVATNSGEPTVDDVAAALGALPRDDRGEAVFVAIGGGATIDLAKAVAALATNTAADSSDLEGVVVDHLEGVGRGLSIARPPLPLVAVPTRAADSRRACGVR